MKANDEFDFTVKFTDLLNKINPKEANIKAIGQFCIDNSIYADAIINQLLEQFNVSFSLD
jgi:hypothetical protein